MSWDFEQKFEGIDNNMNSKTTLFWDGHDMWAITATASRIYTTLFNVWDDRNSEYEKLTYHYYFDNNTDLPLHVNKIKHYKLATDEWLDYYEHTGASGCEIMKYYDKLYILHGTDILIFDIPTRTFIGIETELPEYVVSSTTNPCTGEITETTAAVIKHSNICIADRKMFITGKNVNNVERQSFWRYDLDTKVWTSAVINYPKQIKDGSERYIVYGLDKHVWITNLANNGLLKVNIDTMEVTGVTVNYAPYFMYVNQDKELFVFSDKDSKLISIVDQTTHTVSAFSQGSTAIKRVFDDTQGSMWFFDSDVMKLHKSTLAAYNLGSQYTSSVDAYITPQFKYDRWNGTGFDTITVKPYLYNIAGSKLKAVRLSARVDKNKYNIRGTAMIAVGPQAYRGD